MLTNQQTALVVFLALTQTALGPLVPRWGMATAAGETSSRAAWPLLGDESPKLVEGADSGFIGIYADPEGTVECASIPNGQVDTLYVVATTGSDTQFGIGGAGFRIQVTRPAGYFFAYVPPPSTILASPVVDTTPENPWDGHGGLVIFKQCQSVSHQAGDRIPLGRLLVANFGGEATDLLVQRFTSVDSPRELAPYLWNCDVPRFLSMRRCSTDPWGASIAFRARLNDPGCTSPAPCAEECAGKPCVDFVAHLSPTLAYCPGDSVQTQVRLWNCSGAAEDVKVFVNYSLVAQLDQVAPGDTVLVVRKFRMDRCPPVQNRFFFGAVATHAACPEPSGKEISVAVDCGSCDAPYCPVVATWTTPPREIGQTFSVRIVTQRVRDLFGISGRLRFSPTSGLQALRVRCSNEDGTDMDLGAGTLCFGQVNNQTGTVDFSVSRPGGAFGRTGSLAVARLELQFPPGTSPGQCSNLWLQDLRAIDSFGRPLCVEPPESQSGVCSKDLCVLWPGDTNNDGVVDEADLVTLASYWDLQGPSREEQGCPWREVSADCWPVREATYCDTYGDGKTGPDDVLCIGLNWLRTHATASQPISQAANVDPVALRAALLQMQEFLAANPTAAPGIVAVQKALADLIETGLTPRAASLEQNIPNPFNPSTQVRYRVSARGLVVVRVYDVSGRRVRDLVHEVREPGRYAVEWDGADANGRPVASGVYCCTAIIGGERFTRKMVLAR